MRCTHDRWVQITRKYVVFRASCAIRVQILSTLMSPVHQVIPGRNSTNRVPQFHEPWNSLL